MMQFVPDHSDADTLIELYGPENEGWYSSRIHDWVGLCEDLRDPDARGYLVLRALVYEKFKKPIRNLTLSILCELIPGPNGKPSSPGRVRGILKALSDVGLVSTPEGEPLTTSSRAAAAGRPLRIRINDRPVEGYGGWRNVEAKLQWLQAGKPPLGAGQNSDPVSQRDESEGGAGQNSDPRGRNSDPDSASDLPKRDHPLVLSVGADEDEAISSRSGGDVRRTSSTGSSELEVEGGVAASSTTSPVDLNKPGTAGAGTDKSAAAGKAKHTREQLDLVRTVRAHFPADMLTGWEDREKGVKVGPLPDVEPLSDAILAALAGDMPASERTAAQLGARIEQRWNQHGWASKFYAGDIDRLVGAAVAMVRPLKGSDRYGCANPRCDAGVNVDTQQECPTCPERLAARKAERRQQKAQQGAGESNAGAADLPAMPVQRAPQRRECECGNPIIRSGDDIKCGACRRSADEAPQLVAAQAANSPF